MIGDHPIWPDIVGLAWSRFFLPKARTTATLARLLMAGNGVLKLALGKMIASIPPKQSSSLADILQIARIICRGTGYFAHSASVTAPYCVTTWALKLLRSAYAKQYWIGHENWQFSTHSGERANGYLQSTLPLITNTLQGDVAYRILSESLSGQGPFCESSDSPSYSTNEAISFCPDPYHVPSLDRVPGSCTSAFPAETLVK